MWDVRHPWLNLFIPRSQIQDLYHALTSIIANDTKDFAGPVPSHPLNRSKSVKLTFNPHAIYLYILSSFLTSEPTSNTCFGPHACRVGLSGMGVGFGLQVVK